eukprot:m.139634 g.139634  ORF g.139634 m.139634 type:complete len:170 (+) comp30071_c2_seq1:3978-4487(+)
MADLRLAIRVRMASFPRLRVAAFATGSACMPMWRLGVDTATSVAIAGCWSVLVTGILKSINHTHTVSQTLLRFKSGEEMKSGRIKNPKKGFKFNQMNQNTNSGSKRVRVDAHTLHMWPHQTQCRNLLVVRSVAMYNDGLSKITQTQRVSEKLFFRKEKNQKKKRRKKIE